MAQYEWISFAEFTANEYLEMMLRGDRRCGMKTFRPICSSCCLCTPIRIDVLRFELSGKQRHIIKQNKDTKITLGAPSFSDEKLELTNLFLSERSHQVKWPLVVLSRADFEERHVLSPIPTMEFQFHIGSQLAGLCYTDILPDGLSFNYYYYNPNYSKRSLGHFFTLVHMNHCKEQNLRWLYMGWHVRGYGSFEYKAKYVPNEIVVDGQWKTYKEKN